MFTKTINKTILSMLAILTLAACGTAPLANLQASGAGSAAAAQAASPTATPLPAPTAAPVVVNGAGLAAYESTLEAIYAKVNPSVVTVSVTTNGSGNSPSSQNQGQTPSQSGLGSGFVYDTQGHIITNNHVIDGADIITITFSDGNSYPAKVVGRDPDADLAVLSVSAKSDELKPVTLADSSQVRVGQIAIAIGNPFGEEGSMTNGIISGLGRSLPVDSNQNGNSPSYTIPDIIQTDAPINPGNSGGVLVDIQGQVIGVTAAIESPVRANSGIGFVIPAEIVQRVVPQLIQAGSFQHPWLGISGTDLTSSIAKAMNLPTDQHGILVIDVASGSPAAKAGLKGSTQSTTIDGVDTPIGGDVITAINGEKLSAFNNLATWLVLQGSVGQSVKVDILREGKAQTLDVTLAARPAQTPTSSQQSSNQNPTSSTAFLGIRGVDMNSDIANAMNLPSNQQGVLVVQVASGSPADKAGLKGGLNNITIQGLSIRIGGDVIVKWDNQAIASSQDLQDALQNAKPGDQVALEVIRDGKPLRLSVTLGQR